MPSREGKKKKNSFSFRGLLFWRRFFRRSRPFMQRDASKWPRSLQWSSAAPWLKMNFLLRCRSAPSPCVGTKKQRSSRFSFFVLFLGLFLSPLAWTKLHDVVHRLISMLVPSSDFQPVTSYSSLWNFCLTEWALRATFCCKIIELWWKKKTLSGSKLQNNYLFWSELNKRRYKPPCVAA